MSDLINRQDAIDAIVVWTVEDRPDIEMPTDLVDRVNALPSAERKGKWIRHTRVEPVYSIDGVETWGIKCQCNKYTNWSGGELVISEMTWQAVYDAMADTDRKPHYQMNGGSGNLYYYHEETGECFYY